MSTQGFLKRQDERRRKAIADSEESKRKLAELKLWLEMNKPIGYTRPEMLICMSSSEEPDDHWYQRSRWKFFERLKAGLYQ